MAYQVDKFNGTFLVSVDDGTIDTTTDLRFVGKNYAGYGEVQNENFLHLLENFANTTAPPKVINGQIWYDSGNKKLKFYDGSKFRTASGAEIGTTAPAGLTQGDFWWDTSSEQLKTWNGTEFILIGPAASPAVGEAAAVQDTVKGTDNLNHSILKLISEGEVIAVISAASDFVLNSTTPITGFSTVKKGITLVNTNGTTGVTSTPHYFWGTASNASKLGGFSATDFVRAGAANFSTGLSVSDAGITVGDQNDLRIWVENGNRPIIENQLGEDITFRIKTVSANIDVSKINVTGVYPVTTGDIELGAPSLSWKQVYATKFYGSLQGNVLKSDGVTVLIDHSAGTYKGNLVASDLTTAYNATTKTFTGSFVGNITGNLTGSITGNAGSATTISGVSAAEAATAGTIPIRNLSGNILANRFVGIADKADQLLVDATYRSTSITATGDTIPARNGAGDIYAVKFRGTATAAEYADLAEKYLADQEYEVGTVVSIGGEQEVTACTVGDRAIGVVSTNPAFMMNSELENGTYIALKGRVPVKVIGSVKKGDKLIAASNGTAQVAAYGSHSDIFAISLETNTVLDEKVIEALVL
jgi:hypothetical protein